MKLAPDLSYPIVAIGDLHGQRAELERLLKRLEPLPEWSDCSVVFLGDYVDRGSNVRGTIDLVLELLDRPAGGAAIMGNDDLALVRAAGLDDGPASPYWSDRYRDAYDGYHETFVSYLGREPVTHGNAWRRDLDALREAMPERHRAFLSSLPWVAEAAGHLFLHNGLSTELEASAAEQVEALRAKQWDRSRLRPISGTMTDQLWKPEYPVWLGADRSLSRTPLPHPGKIQVTGHVRVERPDADGVRIRLDTAGGIGTLTACLLRSARGEPEFFASR
jgi:serine/threonine protein phosphatase 1